MLGSVLMDNSVLTNVQEVITADDFSIPAHADIFRAMAALDARSERIDLVTVAEQLKVDPSRLALVGDSVGGHMTAVVTLMAKQRQGPKAKFQVLFYPLVDYLSSNSSYEKFSDGPWLTRANMKWMFDLEGLTGKETDLVTWPGRALA